MSEKQTTCCVRCGKVAKTWAGHVLAKDRKKITAGWCLGCRNATGFCGHLQEWMAVETVNL